MLQIDAVAFDNPGKVTLVSSSPCLLATELRDFAGSTIKQRLRKRIWPNSWKDDLGLPPFPATTHKIVIATLHLNVPDFELEAPFGCILYVHKAVQTVGQLFAALHELFSFPVGMSLWQLWLPPQQDPTFAAGVTDIALRSPAGYSLPIAVLQSVSRSVLMPLCLATAERDVLAPEYASALWRCRNYMRPKVETTSYTTRDTAMMYLMGMLDSFHLHPLPHQDELFDKWWKAQAYTYTSLYIFMNLLLAYYERKGGEAALNLALEYQTVIDFNLDEVTLQFSCKWNNTAAAREYCTKEDYRDFAQKMLPLVNGLMAFSLGMTYSKFNTGHAMVVIVNTALTPHTVELFDPYGADRDVLRSEVLDAVFDWFRLDDGAEWQFHPPAALCLRGPQTSEDLYFPNVGTCTLWSIWFMQLRLWSRPNQTAQSLLETALYQLSVFFPGQAVGMFIYEFARRLFQLAAEEYVRDFPSDDAAPSLTSDSFSAVDIVRWQEYAVPPRPPVQPKGTCSTVRARDVLMVCAADKDLVTPSAGFVALTDVHVTTTRVFDVVTLFVQQDTPLKALPSLLSGAVMKEPVSVVLDVDDDTLFIPLKTRWSVARMNGYIASGVTRLGLSGVTVRALDSRVHVSITTSPAEWVSPRNVRILDELTECEAAVDALDAESN
jgi:hypothetical protein